MQAGVAAHLEPCRLVQQVLQRHGRYGAEHFNLEPIDLIQGFVTAELADRETQAELGERQGEGAFLVVVHQRLFCHEVRGHRGYETLAINSRPRRFFGNTLQRLVRMSITDNTFWSIANFLPYKLAQSVGQ
ncbi:hypothetical protein D3C80_1255670 [compost metagenome]